MIIFEFLISINLHLKVDVKSSLLQNGRETLTYFEKNKALTPVHQQIISNCLIDTALTSKSRLGITDLAKIAKGIVSFFPGENPV